MNNDEKLNLLKQMMTMVFSSITVMMPALAASQHFSLVETASLTGAPALLTLGSIIWSVVAHWNMKKVSETAVAVQPTTPPTQTAVGIVQVTGKVVGALLLGFLILQAAPAMAKDPPTCVDTAHLFPPGCIGGPTVPSLQQLVTHENSEVSTFLTNLAAISDAITLSTAIPGISDPVGNACWTQFAPIQALIKAHPLPVNFKIASDIEAARLAAIALNQICANPNCGQMFVDATNAANALSSSPIPISFQSICSKIPVIGTSAVPTATTTSALIGTTPSALLLGPATPATLATPAK